MKGSVVILLFLTLVGCVPEDRMILREQASLETRQPKGSLFVSSSFWEIARAVEGNAPKPGEAIYRKGRIQFSTQKILRAYDFEYDRVSAQSWSFLLFEKNSKNRVFSLHRNHLGLTLQDLQDQLFEQSYEEDIWKKLDTHPWFDGLKSVLSTMESPRFSPELDWHEEADGLLYYILTRIEQNSDPKDALKHEIYLHKKGRTLNRHIKAKLHVGIVEDIRYSDFIGVGTSYLPHKVMLEFPKKMKRIDINIAETLIRPVPPTGRVLKEF